MFRARHDSVVPTRSLFRSAAQLGFSRVLLSRLVPKRARQKTRHKDGSSNSGGQEKVVGIGGLLALALALQEKAQHCSVMFILARWAITRYDRARRGIMHVTVYQSNRISTFLIACERSDNPRRYPCHTQSDLPPHPISVLLN